LREPVIVFAQNWSSALRLRAHGYQSKTSKSVMWLHNVHLVNEGLKSIGMRDGKFSAITPVAATKESSQEIRLEFSDCIAFPGLINSHDHLEFNLFPRLGNRIYADYTEWGADIHSLNRKAIDAVLKIPKPLRTQWGLYKNLFNGFTTVVHHGEYLPIADAVIAVFQQCHMLHSVHQERWWRWKLNRPWAEPWPFVVHVGEGTNSLAREEIDTLLKWNFFKRKLIGVHGVAMSEEKSAAFAALIWCPDSNYFLLNRTADIARMQQKTAILFGTDSTLTAGWNVWEHLRFARKLAALGDEALFQSVTERPARVWEWPGKGRVREGFQADIVVARRKAGTGDYDSWFAVNPEDITLVIQNGAPKLCDESCYQQLKQQGFDCKPFSKVTVSDSTKYVWGDVSRLIAEIKCYAPEVEVPVKCED
jgi:cytosine/adenosine deaminase-related metal-dependent hydrolase